MTIFTQKKGIYLIYLKKDEHEMFQEFFIFKNILNMLTPAKKTPNTAVRGLQLYTKISCECILKIKVNIL